MLFTGKGDDGKTSTFDCDQMRISKSSSVAEALGAMDECNSYLGICKMQAQTKKFAIAGLSFENILAQAQQSMFTIQAEIAGAPKTIDEEKVLNMEKLINMIETEMPPIKTFFVSGGTVLAAQFDVSRTLARRAERRVIAAIDDGSIAPGEYTRQYLNRLSSLLYALARLTNHKSGITEEPPKYE